MWKLDRLGRSLVAFASAQRAYVLSKVDPDRDRSNPTAPSRLNPESQNQNQRKSRQNKFATAKPITAVPDLLNLPRWRHGEVNRRCGNVAESWRFAAETNGSPRISNGVGRTFKVLSDGFEVRTIHRSQLHRGQSTTSASN